MQTKKSWIITPVALLLIVLMPLSTGCSTEGVSGVYARDTAPFYTDRVVEVRLVTAEENWEFMKDDPLAEEYVQADFWYNGELIPDIAVRTKGNSSLMTTASSGSIRYSLKVDFNFFNSARNLDGVKKLVFNNGFSDPTFMREIIAYEIFAQMGIPTPRASFVDLWMNDTHLGLYTMVEAIDKSFIDNNFTDKFGNLYKPEMPAAYLDWTEEDYDEYLTKEGDTGEEETDPLDINLGGGRLSEIIQALDPQEEEEEEPSGGGGMFGFQFGSGLQWPGMMGGDLVELMGLKTNENKADHSALFRLLEILNNEPDETFAEEIEEVLDVDETLRYLAVSALIVHLDNYIAMGHNFYLYENNGKFVVLPWDLNMAFGSFNYGLNTNQLINYYIDEPSGGPMAQRPLIDRLLSYQPYLDIYHQYLEELLNGPFAVDKVETRINELAELIRPYVEADETKFFNTRQFEQGIYKEHSSLSRNSTSQISSVGTVMSHLSEEGMDFVAETFTVGKFDRMLRRGLNDKEIRLLKTNLADNDMQLIYDVVDNPITMPGMPKFGLDVGLIGFIAERHKSVTEQLTGIRDSGSGAGRGNGGSFGIPGGFGGRGSNFEPPDREN